ncbi:hypothetical protein C8Q80DRAFT_951221 [Daedaleopsis nitida]|nr:hypothetical protein C8Q80DRAFT_951221 [Daedaleopsis nitida]
MNVEKTLVFKSTDLGANLKLLLCFMPPSPELFVDRFPVAWKVTTLSAKGRSTFIATCTNVLGCCVAQVGRGQFVSASNHIPVSTGDQTTLMVDRTINPPAYYFTPPLKSTSSQDAVQVVNGTNVPQNIGFGFITDVDTDRELMHTVLMFPGVKPTFTALAQYIPVVRAYISMNYAEDEMLSADIMNVKPLWEGDMRELQSSTTVVVKRTPQGTYEAHELPGSLHKVPDESETWVSPKGSIEPAMLYSERSFHATMVFHYRADDEQRFKHVIAELVRRGYTVRLSIKECENDVGVELLLPFGLSCAQAKAHLQEMGDREQLYTMTRCNGELHVFHGEHVSCCYDINPASTEWFATGAEPR